jgi:fibronectin type 3 domain-containing protein
MKLNATTALLATLSLTQIAHAEQETLTIANTVIKADQYLLSNYLFDDGVPMLYDPALVEQKGSAFSADYTDPGEFGNSTMDAYLCGIVGGYKTGGNWYPSDYYLTGMPELIDNVDNSLRIQWETFQIDALDAGDKWWATINVLFDNGSATSEPVKDNRDYDIVIQLARYEQDDLEDREMRDNSFYWYYPRNPDGSLIPFTLNIDGQDYHWALRYKFFNYLPGNVNEHKNDKVHIKFIPIDNDNVAPYIDHPLKTFIDASSEYLPYMDLTPEEAALAAEKVNAPDLYVKQLSAGFEVYTGQFTIGNKHFKTVKDTTPPNTLNGLSATLNTDKVDLDWDVHNDDAFQTYTVYRAVNGGIFSAITQGLYINSYTDVDVQEGNSYEYYVSASDRSWNESTASSIVSVSLPPENLPPENLPPVWEESSFSSEATADVVYETFQAWRVTDNEDDPITFTKMSGPAWVTVQANGKVYGTPTSADVGANVVVLSASDGINAPVEATLTIDVISDANSAPVFLADPFSAADATKNVNYNQSLTGSASDADGDTLRYSKVSGPSWLQVASNGSMTGKPKGGNRGTNTFVVSVSDGINEAVTATLTIVVN